MYKQGAFYFQIINDNIGLLDDLVKSFVLDNSLSSFILVSDNANKRKVIIEYLYQELQKKHSIVIFDIGSEIFNFPNGSIIVVDNISNLIAWDDEMRLKHLCDLTFSSNIFLLLGSDSDKFSFKLPDLTSRLSTFSRYVLV